MMLLRLPQSKCDHDIVGGVVEVLVLGDAEQNQQVEDQHQGGEGRVASNLHKMRQNRREDQESYTRTVKSVRNKSTHPDPLDCPLHVPLRLLIRHPNQPASEKVEIFIDEKIDKSKKLTRPPFSRFLAHRIIMQDFIPGKHQLFTTQLREKFSDLLAVSATFRIPPTFSTELPPFAIEIC